MEPLFKIIRIGSHSKRYNYAYVEGHNYSDKRGRVIAHRAIMELYLGRYLEKFEEVHHINGKGKDNRIQNLELMTKAKHTSMHKKIGRTMVILNCPECGVVFEREKRQTHFGNKKSKNTFCTRQYSGKYSNRLRTVG